MDNEPLPFQLTMGELGKIFENVSDGTVIGLVVPPGGIGDSDLETVYNLEIDRTSDSLVLFRPLPVGKETA